MYKNKLGKAAVAIKLKYTVHFQHLRPINRRNVSLNPSWLNTR